MKDDIVSILETDLENYKSGTEAYGRIFKLRQAT